ncbi:MAG TPA: hypothetical protein VGH29_12220 [Candidatus Binataceae bacterium]
MAEALLQKLLAGLLMAATACVFFEIGMHTPLPIIWSAMVAIGGALGTQIWSSASRTLWSQTWEVFLASCAVLLLLQGGERRQHPIRLATLLAWMYFVRPTAVVAVADVTLYLWLFHRRSFATCLIVLSAWMLIFVLYWMAVFGQGLPDYYRQGGLLELTRTAATLPAILISPSRGLLVFVPTVPRCFTWWCDIGKRLTVASRPWPWELSAAMCCWSPPTRTGGVDGPTDLAFLPARFRGSYYWARWAAGVWRRIPVAVR